MVESAGARVALLEQTRGGVTHRGTTACVARRPAPYITSGTDAMAVDDIASVSSRYRGR